MANQFMMGKLARLTFFLPVLSRSGLAHSVLWHWAKKKFMSFQSSWGDIKISKGVLKKICALLEFLESKIHGGDIKLSKGVLKKICALLEFLESKIHGGDIKLSKSVLKKFVPFRVCWAWIVVDGKK
ncbi:hypothetical protein ACOSQ4_032321 [Xanthoceras sorbifolium]